MPEGTFYQVPAHVDHRCLYMSESCPYLDEEQTVVILHINVFSIYCFR